MEPVAAVVWQQAASDASSAFAPALVLRASAETMACKTTEKKKNNNKKEKKKKKKRKKKMKKKKKRKKKMKKKKDRKSCKMSQSSDNLLTFSGA